ncbi:MAG: sulfatase-like hydrolase/transferase [Draconibacterium sp.]|nr:sulfatase-like hydrolase/transferase [Draconibacterium sp.]
MIKKSFFLAFIILIAFSISCNQRKNEPPKPNILFIAIDDMNDWVGVLGGHPQAKTPNIDKQAQRGVLFTNAQTAAPGFSLSRNALLYGMQPNHSGLYPFYDRTKMDPAFFAKHKSLMQLFRSNAYNTFGAGKIHHGTMNKTSIEMSDPFEWNNLAENSQFVQIKNEMKKFLPTSEAPLVLQGKALHNVVDTDKPSLANFNKMWEKMQKRGMNLE